ncbi:PAS domain-containing protein [Clostridium sp. AM58-1XD]|uniref:PAS domain-containing protein n=1 Tax=Clostridium sp. AM58-1XD TaxID=2292307 RepID=UPI000E4B9519|nr:PAS domain-containing protein [Clostridium sp. AM58-1XD]RGZ01586.1 response regulator [Clostridium sp. AM58-1XD]
MEKNRKLLETAEEFCIAWFHQRNLDRAVQYVSEDVLFMGTGEEEEACGLMALREYIRQDMEESKSPFEIVFTSERESVLTEDTGIAAVEFNMSNSEFQWHVHGTFTLTCRDDVWTVRHIHFAVPAAYQEEGEHYPLTVVKTQIAKARQELLSSSVAGGLIGAYLEDRFPLYYINKKMLDYLGYGSEEDFAADIQGFISNCTHPDDRRAVEESISCQLSERDEYVVEYRMRKKNGTYIYVQDMGRTITAEDGRRAIISVCRDISDQKFEKQQNESLIKAMNGGTMICRVTGGRYIPTYLSPGIGSMTGFTKQELKEIISSSIETIIYPKDREKLFSALHRAVENRESVQEDYRVRHVDGHFVWVTGIFQGIGEEDGDPLLRCIFTSLSNQFELQNNILDGTDTGVYVIDPDTYELCLANDGAFRIMNLPVSDYEGKKCFEVFGNKQSPCDHCMLKEGNEEHKEMYIPWLDKTMTMSVKKARWMDRDVLIEYLNDITIQKKAQEELRLGEERLTTAIRHAAVQFWEYDIRSSRAYMSDFSQQSYGVPHIMDDFPQSFLDLNIIHPDDKKAYLKLHEKLRNGSASAMLEYRVKKPGEDYRWLLAHYTTSFDEAGRPQRAFATAESIDRYKEMEEQFTIAARLTGVRVWMLDMQNRTVIFNESDAVELGIIGREMSCGTLEEMRRMDMFYPDDVQMAWEKSRELFEGADGVSFRARLKKGGNYRWSLISYTVMKSKNGTPVKAIGSSKDIHEHVLLEQQFKQEQEYSAGLQEANLINKAQCNITKGVVESYICVEHASVTSQGAPYDQAAEGLVRSAVERDKQERLRYLVNRKRILEAYVKGENYYAVDYQRRNDDGTVFWANTTARIYQNPATGDIMSFMYTYNIDERKMAEMIVDRVVDTNFEYLTVFNTITGRIEKTIDKSGVSVIPEEGRMYEKTTEESLYSMLLPQEIEEYLPLFKIKAITDKLDKNDLYSISADTRDPKVQELRHKLWAFCWFDSQHTKVLCSRSDITEVYRQEQHQKEVLSAALTAAKQANAAKSDFLSRMSHEIRTPMNAIIGMTAIAAKSIGNDDQVSDCISKIGISSRFLLSLINDILDMSRIESGKMLLKNEKIPFKEFVTGVNAICHTQAAAKDVDYECIVDPVMDECYIGDAMKLQQVLVNILGNAIKFTSSGGKVTFSITQRKRTKNDAIVRFVINDTGIGMSEDFLPHLFEPFEQESTGITTGFGGTGLGLAISKNIVDLMDGKIQVRSIKGVGTEFTVDVKLEITEEEKQRHLKKQHAYNFSHLKTLVVDDDITVCESAVLTLKEIGITAEWVDSGMRAVERVKGMWENHHYYDLILIDWKMPEMDGIETSRRIRKIVGPDVTIIIMTAYDWSSIEQEAKAVGVNMLMSKPMFKSNLISAFSKALDQKEEEKQEEIQAEEYDFTGRRLLLVEDQPINAEIAQMLLEDVGFQVETAENGLRAIEMFSKTEEGYYDAILMDIRMPIMDGLQASANIRHLSNKDAKTIPIIAMTADAFDEDADRSKAAGMNLHLAKPIDPPKLYRTLYEFILRKETEGDEW